MSQSIRTFIAIKIPSTPSLRRIGSKLESLGRAVKVVPSDRLHVTLKFLGETDPKSVPEIERANRLVVEKQSAFELAVCGLGAFPNRRRPSVIWAGLEPANVLVAIAEELNAKLELIGFPPEQRTFQPHLTLARIRSKPPSELFELLDQFDAEEFSHTTIESVELYQSELQPSGPQYTVLTSAPLKAS